MEVINGEKVATNPSTGAKVVLRGGKWIPYEATAAKESPVSIGQPSLGERINNFYQQDIAKPATDVAARALTDIGHKITHPGEQLADLTNPAAYMKDAMADRSKGPISPMAREAAGYIIPQTPTAAALDVASIALPEVGAERVLGNAAGPITKALGSRLGRIAAGTAVGAGAGALTGEGPAQGALEGLGAFAPGEVIGAGLSKTLGGTAERLQQKVDLSSFGKALKDTLPWIADLKTPQDFENSFMKGDDSGIIQNALGRLNNIKQGLTQQMRGRLFLVPTPEGMRRMPFEAADKLATDLQKGYGFSLMGQERGGYTAREARALGYQIREHLGNALNMTRRGLGDAYRGAAKQYDAAKTLVGVLGPHGAVTPWGLSQPELLKRIEATNKAGGLLHDLDRSMGKGTRDRLIGILRRGFSGVARDTAGKPGTHSMLNHLIGAGAGAGIGYAVGHPFLGAEIGGLTGIRHGSGATAFDPIGEVNKFVRVSGAPIEALISNLMGERVKPAEAATMGEGVKAFNMHRAEHLAPTPSASDRAVDVDTDLTKGKTPDVHKDLNQGRLSMDETNKLLNHASATDPKAVVYGMPLSEMLDSVQVADANERQALMPFVEQRLRTEIPKLKNKTLQMNLAKRFQQIKSMPAEVEG